VRKVAEYDEQNCNLCKQPTNLKHEEDLGFWTPVIPGLGDINWGHFYAVMKEIDYQGDLSIEHEDRRFAGTNDLVKKGLQFSYNHLQPIITEFK